MESYICPIDAETSGHSKSMSALSLCRAKLCRDGSGSDRKPTRPAAEVRPTMSTTVVATSVDYWRVGGACNGKWPEDGPSLKWDADVLDGLVVRIALLVWTTVQRGRSDKFKGEKRVFEWRSVMKEKSRVDGRLLCDDER
jgi:hypothetical protein